MEESGTFRSFFCENQTLALHSVTALVHSIHPFGGVDTSILTH